MNNEKTPVPEIVTSGRMDLIAPALILLLGGLTMFCGSADLQMVAAYNPAEGESARALALLMSKISPQALNHYFGGGTLYLYATSLLLAPVALFRELPAAGYTAGLRLAASIFLALAAWLALRYARRNLPGVQAVSSAATLMFFPAWLSLTGSSANSLTALLTIPALLSCLKLLEKPGPLPTAAAGLFAGLAFGSSFVGLFLSTIAVVTVIVSLLGQNKSPLTLAVEISGRISFILATFLIGAALAAPQFIFATDVIKSILATGVFTTPMNPLENFGNHSILGTLIEGGAIGALLPLIGIITLATALRTDTFELQTKRSAIVFSAALILLPLEVVLRSGGLTPAPVVLTAAFFPLIFCIAFLYRALVTRLALAKTAVQFAVAGVVLILLAPSAVASVQQFNKLVDRGRHGDVVETGQWLARNYPKNTTFLFDIGTWVPAKFSRAIGRYGQSELELTRAMPGVIVIHMHYLKHYSESLNKPNDIDGSQIFLDHFWFYMRAERGAYPGYKVVNRVGDILVFERL